MERQIRKLGLALLVLFLIVFLQMNYIQVFAADRIAENPANAKRLLIAEWTAAASSRTTGRRSSRRAARAPASSGSSAGTPTASSTRTRPASTRTRSGARSSSRRSTTSSPATRPSCSQTFTDLVLGRPKQGATIVTTLDPEVQEAAAAAAGRGRRRRDRGDRPLDRRRARPPRRADVRPEPARVAGPRGGARGVGRAERRSGEAACLAGERRALPAGLDVQARDRVGGAREGFGPDSRGRTRTSSTSRSPTRRSRTSAARTAWAGPRRSRSPRRSATRAA